MGTTERRLNESNKCVRASRAEQKTWKEELHGFAVVLFSRRDFQFRVASRVFCKGK